MIQIVLILLGSSVLCNAKIKLEIKTASNKYDAKLNYSGVDNKVISDTEISLFNFTKANLNRGMRIELGKVPDDIFWKDPTPYEDLFKKFKWPQVMRNVRIESAKTLDIISVPATISVRDYTNNTPQSILIKINASELVENSINSSWSNDGLPEDEIYFDVCINFNKIDYHYKDKWRNHSVFDIALPMGVTTGYKSVVIKPTQTVTSKITAKKTIMLIEITYVTKLIGNLIADYDYLYGKYHFYSPTVNNIMKAAQMKNEVQNIQWIEIRCYTDPKLEIFDKTSQRSVQIVEHNQFKYKSNNKIEVLHILKPVN